MTIDVPKEEKLAEKKGKKPSILPYEMQPHPANVAYAKAMTAVMIQKIGLKIERPDYGNNFQLAARLICHYFAIKLEAKLDLASRYKLSSEWLLNQEHDEFVIDPHAFEEKLAALELEVPDDACLVVRNLDWLVELFHLTTIERKLLLWSYIEFGRQANHMDIVLSLLWPKNSHQAFKVLASLLDEPIESVSECFKKPYKFSCLTLAEYSNFKSGESPIENRISGTDFLCAVLEYPHRSREGLLQFFNESPAFWNTRPCIESVNTYKFHHPPSLASAMVASALDKPLSAKGIAGLLFHFTGYEFASRHCEPLAAKLDYVRIIKAVKKAAVDCCLANRPFTEFEILQALYAAASKP